MSFFIDPINGFMPNWTTLNFNTAYSLNKKIQIQLSFDNILDTNYRQFASNISAGGRNISFTLGSLLKQKKYQYTCYLISHLGTINL